MTHFFNMHKSLLWVEYQRCFLQCLIDRSGKYSLNALFFCASYSLFISPSDIGSQYEVAVLELVDTAPADITYGGALAGMHGSVVSAWNRTRPGSLHQVPCYRRESEFGIGFWV